MATLFSKLLTRTDIDGGLAIPARSLGWLEFARQRNVRVDDKVIIQEEIVKNQDTATLIRIEVNRKLRVFGADIWGNVKN
ncbi:unnamed protein product [Dovyalis caffra]|uniref:NfeD-like C-terminal domain-containing protein n=1 Tax=Dovyalis caffra TaxID=77055 RepID=A0AAV1SSQ5_9ROSI|nr:unnamed protein product [Dovyalis caffra]